MFLVTLQLYSLALLIDPQCQAAIDANAHSLELIRSVQLTYGTAFLDKPNDIVDQVDWSREGRLERVHSTSLKAAPTRDGRPNGITDVILDADSVKILQNWDQEHTQQITPLNQGTVQARVLPVTESGEAGASAAKWLLFEVSDRPRRTLSELAKVSPKVECLGKMVIDGRELWHIRLETPEESTPTTTKYFYDVYLDPAAGFMIRRLEARAPQRFLSSGKTIKDEHVHEVVDFKDFGNGVFVPMRTRNGTMERWGSEQVVTSVKVNEPIPPETFVMRWPKYAHVQQLPPVNGKIKTTIWGDNQAIGDVSSAADLRALDAELRKDPLVAAELGPLPGEAPLVSPPRSMLTILSAVLVLLVTAMAIAVVVRRIREQRA